MALPTNVVQGNAAHVTHHNTIHALMPTGESVMVKTKAGVPVDGDFTSTPTNGTMAVNSTTNRIWVRLAGVWVEIGPTGIDLGVRVGAGAPEGIVTATVGTLYRRTDEGGGSALYVKQSGSGSTGWMAK